MRTVKRTERALACRWWQSTLPRNAASRLTAMQKVVRMTLRRGREKILSADARYLMRSTGALSRTRHVRPKDSSTTGLLRARLGGVHLFDMEWHTHSRLTLAAVQQLDEFWRDAAERNLTFRSEGAN